MPFPSVCVLRDARFVVVVFGLSVLFAAGAVGQSVGPPVDEAQMWPSPTTEDWKKPCLLQWQRTWEDATAVAHQTGKPILICINMDGEVASEHYAGIRYRSPEIASMYEPYVCVIASVYRHTPRDYDEDGRRIECPRFGTVTCGEHIAIEPLLFEKYMDGNRISPRHIMVELDGSEVYDVYHTWDVASVFNQIQDGIAERGDVPITEIRGDRPIFERVTSRDARDREAVEQAYREGDADLRRQLLEIAKENPDAAPPDMLRQALFGFDPEMIDLARETLAKTTSADNVDLIAEALRAPMNEDEKAQMLDALERIGESSSSQRAQWLSVVHRGLGSGSGPVNADAWKPAQGGSYPAPQAEELPDWADLMARLDRESEVAREQPKDADAHLEVARSALAFARSTAGEAGIVSESGALLTADPSTARRVTRSHYDEARRAALEAQKLGATGWPVDSILTVTTYYLGELEEAYELSESAAENVPDGAEDWASMAVLTIFAEGRYQRIKEAVANEEKWSPRWLTDVHSAYNVLARHPLGTVGQVVWHYDFLAWLGANRYASRVLDEGLSRYPASPELHARLRQVLLDRRGVDGLEERYESMASAEGAPASLGWYAGLASFVAAEFHRRANDSERAEAAYSRSIAHYEKAIAADPEFRESSDFNIALALAGRARLAIEDERLDDALDAILASYERAPGAAGTLDGLNMTPGLTGKLLVSKLQEKGRSEEVARLQAVLDTLDPEHLLEPYVERNR